MDTDFIAAMHRGVWFNPAIDILYFPDQTWDESDVTRLFFGSETWWLLAQLGNDIIHNAKRIALREWGLMAATSFFAFIWKLKFLTKLEEILIVCQEGEKPRDSVQSMLNKVLSNGWKMTNKQPDVGKEEPLLPVLKFVTMKELEEEGVCKETPQ
jgi:hypothetical protein